MKRLFATAARGLEEILAAELGAMGALEVEAQRAGVAFAGELALAYRACLWSRTASRVLLPIGRFAGRTPETLYEGTKALDWARHLGPDETLAVDFTQVGSAFPDTSYAARKVKDAIVDRLRDETGRRPSVDASEPDVRVNVHAREGDVIVSIDLSGESLHRRGWRGPVGAAPLKENVASGALLLADWPTVAAAGGGLVDPMCGAGTIPIEAALMAADVAPGLLRRRFGFERWRGHEPTTWAALLAEAHERDRRAGGALPPIVGYDEDVNAVRAALHNIERAGLRGQVHVERRSLAEAAAVGEHPGLVVVNPPYGERLGRGDELELLYRRLGDRLKQGFPEWTGHILSGNPTLSRFVGLRASRRHILFNGTIECRLLVYPVTAATPREDERAPTPRAPIEGPVVAFRNRLQKNLSHLRKWLRKEDISCYRLYDADLPEYAVRVDCYGEHVRVQENERPASVDPVRAVKRLSDALLAIQEVLEVDDAHIHLKTRQRQRGRSQYEKLDATGELIEVREAGHRFLVNLRDYLDTGLFLDHREVRALIGRLAKGRRFLNLFAYTGTATVYAAAGGATHTTTVDLSNTYLDWARRNFVLNGMTPRHDELVRADCLAWLQETRERWDLIFLDPPTFSNSKAMRESFDVQRDHVALIQAAAARLAPGGELLFSTNKRNFKLDREALADFQVEDLTRATLPRDFARDPKIHTVFRCSATGRD